MHAWYNNTLIAMCLVMHV